VLAESTDTALVALITGGSAVLAAFTGAGWAMVTEKIKAKHAKLVADEQREAERRQARERELRDAFFEAQAAVLDLGLAVGISLDMRADSNARLDGEDLPTQMRSVREKYLAATVSIGRLRAVCDPSCHDKLQALTHEVHKAFGYARTISQQRVKGEEVERVLEEHLNALSDGLAPSLNP
jgi:hypothetical protein